MSTVVDSCNETGTGLIYSKNFKKTGTDSIPLGEGTLSHLYYTL